ncbi:MAG: ABC transporter ATP-binding protein [Bacteroidota bacterium]
MTDPSSTDTAAVPSNGAAAPQAPVLEVAGLTKTYASGARSLTVLQDVSFNVAPGETCAIVGPSGSGKTTLLGLCAGLDVPSSGTVRLVGTDIGPLSEDDRAAVRNEHVGFVFQSFQLIPTLTALENVMVPAELRGASANLRGIHQEAERLLTEVGLGDRTDHYPRQLSGGEQQRVALARAFINRPKILFADEPTGNLDDETGTNVEALLFNLNRAAGTTLVIVTHDLELARRTGRVIRLRRGTVVSDEHVSSGPVSEAQPAPSPSTL